MTHLLRRRGELPPIEPYRELKQDGFDDDVFEVFVDYISPCQILISNDPYDPDPTQEEPNNPCNITLYDCNPTLEDTNNPIPIEVEFDYEMWFTRGADFNLTLQGLEGSILEHLATATNLVDCPITSSLEFVRDLQDFPDLFSALSSEPVDKRDPRFGGCITPVESTISSTSKCEPMTGYLTAYLTPDIVPDAGQEAFIKSGLQRLVRDGMNHDVYVTGNFKKANFIGRRTGEEGEGSSGLTPISRGENDGNTTSSSSKGLDTLGIALLSVGIVVVLALAIAALIYRKRHNNEKDGGSSLRQVTFAEPAVAPDDLSTNELFRRDEESVGSMEGADIPGSLANTDKLAKQNDREEFLKSNGTAPVAAALQPAESATTATATAAVAGTAAVATGAVVAASGKPPRKSRKSSEKSSPRKKKRRESRERRKKLLPIALDSPSLDSIPEEDTDDDSQLLAEQTEPMDTTGILGDQDISSEDEVSTKQDESASL